MCKQRCKDAVCPRLSTPVCQYFSGGVWCVGKSGTLDTISEEEEESWVLS